VDWLRDHFTADELGPEDRVVQRVHQALAADAKLLAIFGLKKIRMFDFPPLVDPGMLPDITASPFSGSDSPRPGLIEADVTIYVTIRFLWARSLQAEPGVGGIATLARHITRLLMSPAHRMLPVQDGDPPQEITLARRCDPQPASWRPVPIGAGPDDAAILVTLPYVYPVPMKAREQVPLHSVAA
jgi:hypothetical protein